MVRLNTNVDQNIAKILADGRVVDDNRSLVKFSRWTTYEKINGGGRMHLQRYRFGRLFRRRGIPSGGTCGIIGQIRNEAAVLVNIGIQSVFGEQLA